MVLNRKTTRHFYKSLYRTELQKIILYKRDDDQNSGTVRTLTVYNCRRRQVSKSGQPIEGDFSANQRTTWVLPAEELNRVGVAYINALDRILDPTDNSTWQPEAGTNIQVKLFGNIVNVDCLRTDAAR